VSKQAVPLRNAQLVSTQTRQQLFQLQMDVQTVVQANGLDQDRKQVVRIRNVLLDNSLPKQRQHQLQTDVQIAAKANGLEQDRKQVVRIRSVLQVNIQLYLLQLKKPKDAQTV
jgi:hypothetical protein